jgi:Major Facilitator Superfamily
VFFLNVPVGLAAVVAGWYLLPRTRRRAESRGTDPGGMVWLAVSTTAGMLAVSSLAGLGLPAWAVACCAASAAGAAVALWRQERRAAAPLLDPPALAASGAARSLAGALCSYLVLFGPLVLFPQVISAQGGSALAAGLLLTSLPAGFGVAAVLADRVFPARWPNGRRCAFGGALAAGSAAALAVPAPHAVSVVLLGLLGAGLGVYTPANNAEIMTALPARDAAAAGGMVNMTRGIGTALGVAVVTLGLHAGALLGHPAVAAGQEISMAALAVAAVAATWAGTGGPGSGTGGRRGRAAGETP